MGEVTTIKLENETKDLLVNIGKKKKLYDNNNLALGEILSEE